MDEAGAFFESTIQTFVREKLSMTDQEIVCSKEDSVLLDAITARQDRPVLRPFVISATIATAFLLSRTLRYLRQGSNNPFY